MKPTAVPASCIQAGDLEQLYRSCFPSISRTLARLGVPDSQLDDVTQDVFLLLHRKRAELRDPSRLRAWSFSFAIRAASDVRRANRRRRTCEELPASLCAPDRTDARLERREALSALQRVLGQLSGELREVFVLIELEELTGPQVAEALALNLNTVYSRLRLARAAFHGAVTRLPGMG